MTRVMPRVPHFRIFTRPAFVALIVLSFLWVLFFWRLLTPSPIDRVIFPEGDFTAHYYAFSDYQAERMGQGELPLWNPYNHSGDTFAGNIQFVTWYPLRWIAIGLAGAGNWSIEAYQLEVAVHYWLVSLMMYAFLRLLVKRPVVALIGSVLYTYSGYLTGYPMLQVSVMESVAWTPLVFFGLELSMKHPRWLVRGSVVAGIGVALSFLGGHPQTTLQILYLALAYLAFAVYRGRISPVGLVLRAGIFGGLGGGLAIIQLLPAWEFTGLSARVASLGYVDKSNGFTVGEFLGTIFPKLFGVWSPLYIGVAGFLLAVGAMLRPKAQHAFWIGVIVVGLLLGLGGNSIVYDFFYNFVPGWSIFRQQERTASWVAFALVVLATYQADWLFAGNQEKVDQKRFAWLTTEHLLLVGFVLLAVMIGEFIQTGATGETVNTLGFVVLVAVLFLGWRVWQKSETSWLIPATLILLIVFDLFTINTRSENFLPDVPENRPQLPVSLEPYIVENPQDIAWRVDGGAGLQGYGTFDRIPDIYGTGPFWLERIEQLRHIPVDRFWEVLSVRYITTFDEPPSNVSLELLAYDTNLTGDEFRVFELQDPRPMAYLVYEALDAQNSPEFAREIMADARVNLREQAVTLQPPPIELPGERPDVAEVSDFQMVTPEHIEMTVSTGDNALLTVSIPDYPGWNAYVNDEHVDILDTYAGLIGIPVTAGENQSVRLEFTPRSVTIGAILSALALLAGIVVCIAEVFWLRQRKNES